MGITVHTDNHDMSMCYGHFGGFVEDVVEFCRDNCNPTEDEQNALYTLENYSSDGTDLDPETCKHLFNVITREGKLAAFIHNNYTSDPFWTTPWGEHRRVPLGKVVDAVFGIIAAPYDDWKWNGGEQKYIRPVNNRKTLTRSMSPRALELCSMATTSGASVDDEHWKEYWKAMDEYYEFINSEDDDQTFNFEPEIGGMEDSWLEQFIIILADAAINGNTAQIS